MEVCSRVAAVPAEKQLSHCVWADAFLVLGALVMDQLEDTLLICAQNCTDQRFVLSGETNDDHKK